MYALERYDLVFITGESGSAKSSIIRLAERTFNKQLQSSNVSHPIVNSPPMYTRLSFVKGESDPHEKQRSVIVNTILPDAYDEDQVRPEALLIVRSSLIIR